MEQRPKKYFADWARNKYRTDPEHRERIREAQYRYRRRKSAEKKVAKELAIRMGLQKEKVREGFCEVCGISVFSEFAADCVDHDKKRGL